MYVDECLDGVLKLMQSDCIEPVNIGSDEMVSINQLVDIACEVGDKSVVKKHIPGPEGVRGRNSDNNFIEKCIGWKPETKLIDGIRKTYEWINGMVKNESRNN